MGENRIPAGSTFIEHPGEDQSNEARRFLRETEPLTQRTYTPSLAIVERSAGSYHWTPEGRKLADFSSGVLVANVGHSHPKVVAAIREQAGDVINCYDFVSEWRVGLAERLIEITPDNLDRAFILTTGSEAVEAALKIARHATGRKEIIERYVRQVQFSFQVGQGSNTHIGL